MTKKSFNWMPKGNYIAGGFRMPEDPNGEWVSKSPADYEDILGTYPYSYQSVDEAVQSAHHAFRSWRMTSLEQRTECMRRYQQALKQREGELVEAIAREVGKPLWEAKTEFNAMIGKVDITINESMKLVSDYEIPQIAPGTKGACRYRPLGVMAVIGPFNFPGHLPNGHIVPALLTGNTVVFKPSEKAPTVGQIMAECFHESELPSGVFNLLQGEREVGRRLCSHKNVAGVLFTGSYEVGTRIKQDTLQQHWKLLALEMGGKNPALVWKDADLDHAVYETLFGAFVTAGQRCSATSRIMVHADLFPQFLKRFHERAKAFQIGHPLENPFMGPLIESSVVDRYLKFLGIAEREGAEIIMRGKALQTDYEGNYVAPSICAIHQPDLESTQKSVYQQTELFAPNVAIMPIRELEEAAALANATQYGLVASVFTKDRSVYEKLWNELEFGLINWNKPTVGASSKLPFGGLKKSGNHFPTALTATLYCTSPVASLETEAPAELGSQKNLPGLNWE